MIESVPSPADVAWREHQQRLGNLTEREETLIETAFRSGWRAAANRYAPTATRQVEQ